MGFEEKIEKSLNRYFEYCATSLKKISLVDKNIPKALGKIVLKFEKGRLNDNFLILSLFENRSKEMEDKETRKKLLLVDYLVNIGNAFLVRIDWNLGNPIANLLEQIGNKYKNIDKKIKLIILG